MATLLSESIWDICTALAGSASSTRAAIAYVGRDGAAMMPLRPGDTIVVDGSRRALRAGSSNPSAIETWVRRGVHVYSKEGLHAKVILFEHAGLSTAIVGSANVSGHSAKHLVEAAVQSQDPSLIADVGQFIDLLVAEAGQPLDGAWVQAARKVYRPPSALPRRKSARPFPGSFVPLWVSDFSSDTSKQPSKAAISAIAAASLDYDSHTSIESWLLVAGDENKVRVGDGVALVQIPRGRTISRPDGRWTVWPPGVVLRVIDNTPGPPEAIIATDRRYPTFKFAAIRSIYRAHATAVNFDEPVLPGPLHDALLALWKR
jgi:hypothetical protein